MEGRRSSSNKVQLGRRKFIRSTTLGLAALPILTAEAKSPQDDPATLKVPSPKLGLGLASYTLRAFNLDQVITTTKRVELSRIVLKSMHLPLESPEETIRAAAGKVRAAGLDLYGCGVVYMTKEAEVEQAFRYAKTAGMRMIIGAPNLELLDLVNRKVKEYDIQLAIHNHGPDNILFPTPGSAYEKIKNLDRRIGLCMDIGHTLRAGVEPSAEALKYGDRLLDVHIKDVSAAAKEGQTVEIGRGIIDIPKFIRTMIKLDYAGTLAFEYEKDEKDPLPGLAESVGYVRGVIASVQ